MKDKPPPNIQKRIIRGPMHKDGTPGLLYFRVRVEQADKRLLPVRVDLPLLTVSRIEAEKRALVLVKALYTLGVRVIGFFPLPKIDEPKKPRKRGKKSKQPLPPALPGAARWL